MFRNQKMKISLFMILSIYFFMSCQESQPMDYRSLVDRGAFNTAKEQIQKILDADKDMPSDQRNELIFEIERMERIRKNFNKSEDEVFSYIQKYIPSVTKQDLCEWEDEKSLEFMIIDGEKRYFYRAARNLFRINKECNRIWQEYHRERNIDTEYEKMDYYTHNRNIIDEVIKSGNNFVLPVKISVQYTLTVTANMVPKGETIRCWIPYPREIKGRQDLIRLILTDPAKYDLASNENLQRTIYLEKQSSGNAETVFVVEYEFVNHGVYYDIDPEKIIKVKEDSSLARYLGEEPPHIVFTDDLKKLSKKLIGDEANPYRRAQILFAWVYTNTPWASAREYSTIRNLSDYGFRNKHGDCGIQSLLFITLCRMNGIPARWQSGWDFKPPYDSMHDWGMIYFEPYGWMPMDAYYGLHDTEADKLKWFYLNGMDSYRLIFNDAYAQPFVPPKKYHRSETIDSQRGEVEWSGGNLYFDQWTWDMQWKVLQE